MTTFKSKFLKKIVSRGYMHQCTDSRGLDIVLAGENSCLGYIGFDCTADSLHVGSLVPIMLLRHFQMTGHKPIVLLGGGTTMVGDPSGKDESRALLSKQQISSNMEAIKRIIEKFLVFGDRKTDAVFIDNSDWLSGLSYIPFLREFGKLFSVNRMMTLESVKRRLDREQPLSFLEFNYMILQAYDFLELYRRKRCILQMGGSDQWGNITSGVELGRRAEGTTLFGLTTPLISTASGAKMGKTAQGAIWLSEKRLSPYDYFQFWRNAADPDVGRFLRLFTELPLSDIKQLELLEGAELNEAKEILAFEATKLCHGKPVAKASRDTATAMFKEGEIDLRLPTISINRITLDRGIKAFNALVVAGLAKSNSDARRLIRGGGAFLNGEPITDETVTISSLDITKNGTIRLSVGKKRHVLLRHDEK